MQYLRRILAALALAAMILAPAAATADPSHYIFDVSVGKANITGYTGPGGDITIPNTLGDDHSVTSIGYRAFYNCTTLSSVSIPDSVTTIGDYAFYFCINLASVSIPVSVTTIGNYAFYACESLTSVTIGNSVATIGERAFGSTKLTRVTIPSSVTTIGNGAFINCTSLTSAYFAGNPPNLGSGVFYSAPVTIYYLPANATQWADYPTFADRPTALWLPAVTQSGLDADSGAFTLSTFWAPDQSVTVEAATRLVNPDWQPLQTTTIPPSGLLDFTDPDAPDHPTRFYRVVTP